MTQAELIVLHPIRFLSPSPSSFANRKTKSMFNCGSTSRLVENLPALSLSWHVLWKFLSLKVEGGDKTWVCKGKKYTHTHWTVNKYKYTFEYRSVAGLDCENMWGWFPEPSGRYRPPFSLGLYQWMCVFFCRFHPRIPNKSIHTIRPIEIFGGGFFFKHKNKYHRARVVVDGLLVWRLKVRRRQQLFSCSGQ